VSDNDECHFAGTTAERCAFDTVQTDVRLENDRTLRNIQYLVTVTWTRI